MCQQEMEPTVYQRHIVGENLQNNQYYHFTESTDAIQMEKGVWQEAQVTSQLAAGAIHHQYPSGSHP